jgi:hypothetical protein
MEDSAGTRLIEALGQSAGERGAHHLIAEVDEGSPAFESLRQTGFAIYARQRIWRLELPQVSAPVKPGSSPWRPEASTDLVSIRNLYFTLVPPLVQQVEPLAERPGAGFVYAPQDEVFAYLETERGPLGTWLQAYFHPAADDAEELLAAFLAGMVDPRRRPLYACVRSYQSWMNRALEKLGFLPLRDQAVMVKRLAVAVQAEIQVAERGLASARAEPTAPIRTVDSRR